MLIALKSARDIFTKMSYNGFEIKDEKDLLKCLLSIVIDYLGSIFHDRDNNQQQDTIFHHLAQGICYTLGDKLKAKSGLGKVDENSYRGGTGSGKSFSRERCQSSSSCVKLLESSVDSLGFEELNISFDLTSLSYAYSLLSSSNHVIFLDTRVVYPLSTDLLCKYIYYRSSQGKIDKGDESVTSDGHSNQSVISCSQFDENLKCPNEDKIEIHRFPQVLDESNELDPSSPVVSLPVSKYQSINSRQSLLRSLLIPGSRLINVEIGQKYCFLYINCDQSILGRSEPFQFDIDPNNEQMSSLKHEETDSDDDGFVIVES